MKLHLRVCAALLALALAGPAHAGDALVYVPSPQTARLFDTASEKAAFWPLMSAFVSEQNQAFCGVASAVMALNALRVAPPLSPQWYPYEYWDQQNIFSRAVLEVKPVLAVQSQGLTLEELTRLLNAAGAKAEAVHAQDTDLAAFRTAARKALADENAVLLVNVFRQTLGQEGGGHFSPIAAYNAEADAFLFLDVARYKLPPSWIPAERLFAAMNTEDGSVHKSRGYIIVRK
ncbi:phytochelatin synthase family protein [Aquabacter sediminis]|uniref:phytochelatin synthase family protein n=1 Tax=Aquabacter sediminis TaxID=3029197 RepID=UPI00237D3FF5|nr:phytochelatin synthase family protein [Aquabacter sp. P-9]MDE1569342.1 phytochelatin synthase family protein [Aquabacter sp. P-9]